MPAPYRVQFTVAFENVAFEAGLNGVPLLRLAKAGTFSSVQVADPWLLPWGNRVTARVKPIHEQGTKAITSVALGAKPYVEEARRPWAQFKWVHRGLPFEPFDVALPFEAGVEVPTTLWHKADVIHDPAEDLPALQAAAVAVADAFVRKDLEGIVALAALRSEDMAKVSDFTPDEYEARTRKLFGGALTGTFDPADPATLRFTSSCDGRLMAVSRADGAELVDGTDAAIPVFFSRVDGTWRWSR